MRKNGKQIVALIFRILSFLIYVIILAKLLGSDVSRIVIFLLSFIPTIFLLVQLIWQKKWVGRIIFIVEILIVLTIFGISSIPVSDNFSLISQWGLFVLAGYNLILTGLIYGRLEKRE